MTDPLAAEWALAAEMEAEIRRQRGELVVDDDTERMRAEGRWLVRGYVQSQLALRSLPWDEFLERRHHVFMLDGDHQCAGGTCVQLQAPPNVRFLDPQTGTGYAATGCVYVCTTSGAVHLCTDALCTAETQLAQGTVLCPISGRYKSAVLSSLETFNERETRLSDSRYSRNKRPARAAASAPKRTRAPDATHSQQVREAERICRELVCNGTIRRAIEAQLGAIDAGMQTEVRRAVARDGRWADVPALAAFVVAYCAQHHVDAILHMCAAGPLPAMPDARVHYLAQCVSELYTLVRHTDNNKNITLRRMCIPLLYVMMRGLVGIIETSRQTGAIIDRHVRADDGSAYAVRSVDAAPTVVRCYTFVPAHPWLRPLLPANEHMLPAIAGWEDEIGNSMRRMRSIEQAFLQAMRGADHDVTSYCLASHVDPLQTSV